MRSNLIFVWAACLACTVFSTIQDAETFQLNPHIIGGSTVNPSTREYAVLFRMAKDYKKYDYCYGVRLNNEWILTAAQCLDTTKYTHFRFTVSDNGKFVHRHIQWRNLKYKIYPRYNATTKENNIGLLRSDFPDWNDESKYLKLPAMSDSQNKHLEDIAEVTGFERTHVNQEEIISLNGFHVVITNPQKCFGKHGNAFYMAEQVCASSLHFGQAQGLSESDIGAPLILKNNTLLGMALEVRPFSKDSNEPMVFVRISPYLQWISNITEIPLGD